eukprot:14369911-Heterocapsa_arctica.AAC.1
MAWERQVQEYDRSSGRPMEGCVKIAAVVDGAPPTVRQFLRMVPVRITDYHDLRAAVRGFLDRGT